MSITYTQTLPVSTPADPYSSIIKSVFRIDDVTWGDEKGPYLVRFRGELLFAPEQAYDRLVTALTPLNVTPLFRQESGKHEIVLLQGIHKVRPSNPTTNYVLFGLTVISVLLAGTYSVYSGPSTTDFALIWPHLLPALKLGMAFTVSLLAILLAHEFGHYLAGRFHRSAVTLPYFIPFPLSPFGTMGAFIQLKEPPKNKRILLDIGIAGPLAGLIVAIPVLFIGLHLSEITRLPLLQSGEPLSLEGNSILYLLFKYIVFGQWLPDPGNAGISNQFVYWIRYFFTGQPVPFGAIDVQLHPVAWAGWAGLLITALNLIPAGQLDGGHILYVLIGKKARLILPFILAAMILLGFVWNGWWLWAFLTFFLGRIYAEPLDQITPLDPKRKALAIFALILFILIFPPIPLSLFTS